MAAKYLVKVKEHKVKDGDSIKSVAEENGLTWQELAKFNWGTDNPNEINVQLRDKVGCTEKTKDGNNYIFSSSDDPGIIFIPMDFPKKGFGTNQTHNFTVSPYHRILPKIEYDIVEIVEIVDQDKIKWVKGVGMDTAQIEEFVERNDKDGDDFKQYINIEQDIEGKNLRHPEYGRIVILKARIIQKSGPENLSDVKVVFNYEKTHGPNKENADVWITGKELTGDQKEGFTKPNGEKTKTVKTDTEGWTEPVSFFVSKYGGDKFEIAAELHPGVPGAGKKVKTNVKYVVWKKFWYQLTYADGFAIKTPTAAEVAFEEVFVEMSNSSKKKFFKIDLPNDLQNRTFYEEYMLKEGGGNSIVATVGSNNKEEFAKKPIFDKDEKKEHPIKANVIACNFQCDAKGRTGIKVITLTANDQEVKMPDDAGPIICKPPIKENTNLVVFGEWSKTKSPWKKEGNINDDAIIIDSGRSDTLKIKIDLAKGATGSPPVPTIANPIYVQLSVQTAKDYLGESFGSGQVLCVYQPGTTNPEQGSELDYNNTVAHELGHMWNQTPPLNGTVPKSLKDHPLRYEGHGGQGAHCRDGVKQYMRTTGQSGTPGPVDWSDKQQELPEPLEGTCIMFGTYSPKCNNKFCSTCKPYLQLQDMEKI